MKRSVIQFYRGASDNLPQLLPGEPAFTLDSQKFYVGGLSGNVEINTDSSGGGAAFNGGSVGSPIEVISNIWPQFVAAASENEVVAYAWKSGGDIIWTIHKDEEDSLHLIDYQNNASYMTFRVPSSGDEYIRAHKRLGVGGSPASSIHNYGGFYNEGSAVVTGGLFSLPQVSIGTSDSACALHVNGGIKGTSAYLSSGLTLEDRIIIDEPTNSDALIARRNGSAGFSFEGYGSFAYGFISLNRARGARLSPSTIQAGDILGHVTFNAWDSDFGQFAQGGIIRARATSNWGTNDYGTQLEIYRARSGKDSVTKAFVVGDTIEANGDNEDVDFEIKGTDSNNGLFFVDAGDNRVGVGTSEPSTTFHVKGDSDAVLLEGDTSIRIDFIDNESATGFQRFAFALNSESLNISLREDDGSFKQTFINFDTNSGDYYTDIKHGALINSSGADSDTIISGDTEPNLIYVDAGADTVGIGTATPASILHVFGKGLLENNSTGVTAPFTLANYDTTNGNGVVIRFDTATTGTGAKDTFLAQIAAIFNEHDDATRDATFQFRVMEGGGYHVAMQVGDGVIIGNPTGGLPGRGWLNVQNGIKKNNTTYTNPDYVLEHWDTGKIDFHADKPGAEHYKGLVPLNDLEDYLRDNWHLPNRWESQNLFDWADMAQMWSEELAIYITQLHNRVSELESENDRLKSQVSDILSRLEKAGI